MAKITMTIEMDTDKESLESVFNGLVKQSGEMLVKIDMPVHRLADIGATNIKFEESDNTDRDTLPDDVQQFIGEDTAADLDADGLPWDERIHSGSRKVNKDGTWKKRKGVDDDTVASVTAELRAAVNAGTEASAVPPPPAPGVAAPAVPPPPAPPVPASEPPAATWTWPELFRAVADARATEQLSKEVYDQALANVGIDPADGIALLAPLVDKYDQFAAECGLTK